MKDLDLLFLNRPNVRLLLDFNSLDQLQNDLDQTYHFNPLMTLFS